MSDDLISRSALYEQVAEYEEQARNRYFDTPPESDYRQVCMAALTEITSVKHMICDAPAVDAAKVVRCKDCIRWYEREPVCLKIYSDSGCHYSAWQERKPNDFCSYGERKDNETD